MTARNSSVPANICIVMMSAVGDAVHVLPVINALKRENPAARITWVLQPGPAAFWEARPGLTFLRAASGVTRARPCVSPRRLEALHIRIRTA